MFRTGKSIETESSLVVAGASADGAGKWGGTRPLTGRKFLVAMNLFYD